jgi:hypothetical protein
MNMDYSFCKAIEHGNMDGMKRCIGFYDINCQHYKTFLKRVAENEHLSIPEKLQIFRAIGLFHVHGHQDSCLARFAPTYLKGAGMVDGEILETLWSVLNEISPSTRGATLAYRAELLNAHMNDSNLKKLIQMCKHAFPLYYHVDDMTCLNSHDSLQKVY